MSGRVATAPASADGGDTTWTHSAVGDGAGNVYLRCSSRRRHGRDVRGAGTTTRQVVREVAPRRGGYQWPAGVGVPVAGAPSRVVVRMAPHSGHVYVAGTTGGTLYLDGAVFKGGGGGRRPRGDAGREGDGAGNGDGGGGSRGCVDSQLGPPSRRGRGAPPRQRPPKRPGGHRSTPLWANRSPYATTRTRSGRSRANAACHSAQRRTAAADETPGRGAAAAAEGGHPAPQRLPPVIGVVRHDQLPPADEDPRRPRPWNPAAGPRPRSSHPRCGPRRGRPAGAGAPPPPGRRRRRNPHRRAAARHVHGGHRRPVPRRAAAPRRRRRGRARGGHRRVGRQAHGRPNGVPIGRRAAAVGAAGGGTPRAPPAAPRGGWAASAPPAEPW